MAANSPELSVVDSLAQLVATSATWQAWMGSPGNAAAAYARVYQFGIEAPFTRPLAMVAPTNKWRHLLMDARWPRCELYLLFEDTVSAADATNIQAAKQTFANRSGNVIMEMLDKSRDDGGHVLLQDIQPLTGPRRSPREERATLGDYIEEAYRVIVGLDG